MMERDKEKDTYKYEVKQDGKVIFRGWTYDLNRREVEHAAGYPGCTVEQVGKKTTRQEAEAWLGRYK